MLCRTTGRSAVTHIPGVLAVAGLLAVGGCTPTLDGELAPARPTIVFQNGTDTYVRVYLIQNETRWPLGRVRPFGIEELRLPTSLTHASAGVLQLGVVPLGASGHPLYGPRDEQQMIRSAPELVDRLLTMKWRVSGGHIWGLPDPPAKPRIPVRVRDVPGVAQT